MITDKTRFLVARFGKRQQNFDGIGRQVTSKCEKSFQHTEFVFGPEKNTRCLQS
jgi:hypothetical protein